MSNSILIITQERAQAHTSQLLLVYFEIKIY